MTKNKIPKEPKLRGGPDTPERYASMDRWMKWLKKYYPDRYNKLQGK